MGAKKKIASLFIDLETLGVWDDSVIMSMGLTIINDAALKLPHLGYKDFLSTSVEYKYDVMDQVKNYGRKIDPKTLQWWQSQGDKVNHILKKSDQDRPLANMITDIEYYCNRHDIDIDECRIFDRNQAFDIRKLHHVQQFSLSGGDFPPWDVKEVWGIETLLRFTSPQESRYGAIEPHSFDDPAFMYHSAKCDSALDGYRFYLLMNGK